MIFNLDTILKITRAPKPFNEAMASSILNVSMDAFIAINSDSIILEWNKAAETMFGWTREEVLGESIQNIILPRRYISQHRLGMKNYVKTGEHRILNQRIEVPAINKAGHEFPVELTVVPMPSDRGLVFTASIRDLRPRQKDEDQKNLLQEELNHRIKNIMSVIQAVSQQTLKGDQAVQFNARLFAMSKIHDLLFKSNWREANLYELIETGTYLYGGTEQFEIIGNKSILIPANAATSFALILHELITNAIKYGALSKNEAGHARGQVRITWARINNSLIWSWKEVGGPPVTEPTLKGFGTKLIQRAFSGEGTSMIEYEPDGIKCTITLGTARTEQEALENKTDLT